MKSITFDISNYNFYEKPLLELRSFEHIHPNDVVGWYEKIYLEYDDYYQNYTEVLF